MTALFINRTRKFNKTIVYNLPKQWQIKFNYLLIVMQLDAWSPKKALNKNIIYIDSLMKYEN